MKMFQRALTRVEVIVIIGSVLFLLCMVLPALTPAHEAKRKIDCRSNLMKLGQAMAAYREDNGGFFPFSWQRAGEAEPEGTGAANAAMTGTSLGNLYPRYLQVSNLFRCPSTEDQPSFVLNLPVENRAAFRIETRGGVQVQTFVGPLPQGSNWSLLSSLQVSETSTAIRASSYGYDPRLSPRAQNAEVVAADWDGSWQAHGDTTIQNHNEGQNVLFVDGHAKWKETNFCSIDPNDNIYSENAWDADTDSFLVDTDAGLGVSFDGYEHLHCPPYDRRASPPHDWRASPPNDRRASPPNDRRASPPNDRRASPQEPKP
jgi:prepilin-type processing-associated H-X9-DG protein